MSTAKMTATAKAAQTKLKAEAKRRIKRVGTAAKQLEEDLKWIANNKAWNLLGYKNFPEMFESENGYPMGPVVRNIVAYAIFAEGMRGPGYTGTASGHGNAAVAEMLGLPVETKKNGVRTSAAISNLHGEYKAGVPAAHATTNSRARSDRSKHLGAGPDELVQVGFGVPRRVRDWFRNEARTAVTPIPDAELYRQVLIAHMDKVEAGRKANRRTTRSKGRAA